MDVKDILKAFQMKIVKIDSQIQVLINEGFFSH